MAKWSGVQLLSPLYSHAHEQNLIPVSTRPPPQFPQGQNVKIDRILSQSMIQTTVTCAEIYKELAIAVSFFQ